MAGEITGYKCTPIKNFLGKGGEVKVEFKDTKSKTKVFTAHASSKKVKLFGLIDKYSTSASPNITAKEVISLRTEFAKKFLPYNGGGNRHTEFYTGLDFLLNTFNSKDSDGGKDITPKEIAHMFEAIVNWLE